MHELARTRFAAALAGWCPESKVAAGRGQGAHGACKDAVTRYLEVAPADAGATSATTHHREGALCRYWLGSVFW